MKDTETRTLRAPEGVCKQMVAMRMLPAERAGLIALAEREQRSIGSMARLVYLKGLESMQRDVSTSTR